MSPLLNETQHLQWKQLRGTWNRIQAERGKREINQKKLALRQGVTPSTVSNYLNGIEPLNTHWKLAFAEFLRVNPIDIWPEFEFKNLLQLELDEDAIDFIREYQKLSPEEREFLRRIKDNIKQQRS